MANLNIKINISTEKEKILNTEKNLEKLKEI